MEFAQELSQYISDDYQTPFDLYKDNDYRHAMYEHEIIKYLSINFNKGLSNIVAEHRITGFGLNIFSEKKKQI